MTVVTSRFPLIISVAEEYEWSVNMREREATVEMQGITSRSVKLGWRRCDVVLACCVLRSALVSQVEFHHLRRRIDGKTTDSATESLGDNDDRDGTT